jgi:hypothetical protein
MDQDNSPSNTTADIPEPNPQYVQRLKRVVITLGVLMIAGMVALVVGLVVKSKRERVVLPENGFEINARLPANANIKSTELNGDRLAVRITTGHGEQIILFNIKRGTRIGQINFK